MKEQFAIQVFDLKPGQARYLVNKDLWDLADSRTKAGLVLHEAIYRDAHNAGQTNSDDARYFNSQISSAQFADLTVDGYLSILAASGLDGSIRADLLFPGTFFKSINFDSHLLKISNFKADSSTNQLDQVNVDAYPSDAWNSEILLTSGQNLHVFHMNCTLSSPPQTDDGCQMMLTPSAQGVSMDTSLFGIPVKIQAPGDIFVGIDGSLRSGILEGPANLQAGGATVSLSTGDYVKFTDAGNLDGFVSNAGVPYTTSVFDRFIQLDTKNGVYFYPNGSIQLATPLEAAQVSLQGQSFVIAGDLHILHTGPAIRFWPNGAVRSVEEAWTSDESKSWNCNTAVLNFKLFDGSLVQIKPCDNFTFELDPKGNIISLKDKNSTS